MSSHVDERVVEMRFENAQFEKGVSQTMTSLEKLNDSLKFDGAEKSFNELQRAANLFTLSNIEDNVSSLSNSFSVLGVMGMTALNRITNSAISMGMNLVKSLSFGQMQAGFAKYEKDLESVQMIMNSTGESIEYVEDHLKTLNWYTDETSYDYAGMIDTIAKFTSSNIALDDAIPMIIGIANACGLAGVNAQKANHAFEGLSRAIGQGYLARNNWMWVKTSGLANNTRFKQTIIDTAEEMGELQKVADDLWVTLDGHEVDLASFEANLKDKWVTGEVLAKVFKLYGEDTLALKDFIDAHEDFDTAGEALEAYADQMSELGYQSFKASQVARTFTDAINATKDAASTQWMTTYKYLFGNFEEASVMWTKLSNDLWEIFVSGAAERNKELLEPWVAQGGRDSFVAGLFNLFEALKNTIMEVKAAFGTLFPSIDVDILLDWTYRFEAFTEKVRDAFTVIHQRTEPVRSIFEKIAEGVASATSAQEEFSDSVEKTVKPLKDLTEVANQVIYGTYGNGEARVKALTDAGYVYEDVQDKVNELLGCEFRYNKQHEETNKSLEATEDSAKGATKSLLDLAEELRPTRHYSTLDNIISTLRGFIAIARIIKNAVTAVFRIIKPGLALILKMGDAVLGITGTLGDFLEMIADYIEENDLIYNGLKKIVDIFATAFSPMFEKIRQFLEYLADRGFINDLLDKFDEFNEKTGFTEKAAGALKIVFGAIEKIAGGVATAFATIVSVIANSPLLTGLVSALTVVLNFLVGLKQQFIDPAWNFVKNVLTGFVTSLTNIFGVLNPVQIAVKVLTGLLVILGGAIAAVIAPFALFIHAFVNSKAFEYLKTAVAALVELFKQLYTQFAAPALKKAGDKFTAFAERVKNTEFTVENFLNTFKGALTWATTRLINSKLVWPFQALLRSDAFNNGYNAIYKWAKTVKEFLETMIKGGKDADGVSNRLKATQAAFKAFSDGIEKALTGPLSFLGKFRDKVIEVINAIKKSFEGKSISDIIDSILTKARLVAYIGTLVTIIGVLRNLGDVFGGAASFIKEFAFSFKNWNRYIKSRTILTVAFAIGVLAGSLYLLSKADPQGLERARDALLSISIIMMIIVGIMSAVIAAGLNSKNKVDVGSQFFQMALGFLAIAGTLLLVAIALNVFAQFDFGQMVKALTYVTMIIVGMLGIMLILSKITFKTSPKDLFFALTGMFVFAVTLQKMVDVLVQLASMDTKDIDANLGTLIKIMIILGGLMFAASKLTGFSGVGMLLMVVSLYLFLHLLERIEEINIPKIIASMQDYKELAWMLVVLAGILFIAGKGGISVAATIAVMAFAVAMFAKVIKSLSDIPEEDLEKGKNIINALIGMVAAFLVVATACKILSSKMMGDKLAIGSTIGPIIALVVGLIALTGLMVVLGWLYKNHQDIIEQGFNILSYLAIMLGALLVCAALAKGAAPGVLALVLLMGMVLAAFYIMDKMDPDKTLKNAIALGAVIGGIGLALLAFVGLAWLLQAAKVTMALLLGFIGTLTVIAGIIVGGVIYGIIKFTEAIDHVVEAVSKTAEVDGAAVEANLTHIANGLASFGTVFKAYGPGSLFEGNVIKQIADAINVIVPFMEMAKDFEKTVDAEGNVGTAQGENIKNGMLAMAEGFKAFGEIMQTYWFTNGAATSMTKISDAIAKLAPHIETIGAIRASKFKSNMQAIAESFEYFGGASATKGGTGATGDEWSVDRANAISILVDAISPLMECVPDIVNLNTEGFSSGMEAIGGAFVALGTALGDPTVGDVFGATRADAIATLAGSLGTLGTGVKDFITNTNGVDIEKQVKPALTAIGEGLGSFAGAFEHSGMFDTERANGIATLAGSLTTLADNTKYFIDQDKNGDFEDSLESIGAAYKSFGEAIHIAGGFLTDADSGVDSIIKLVGGIDSLVPMLLTARDMFSDPNKKSMADVVTELGEAFQTMAGLAATGLTPDQQLDINGFFEPLSGHIRDVAVAISQLKTYLTEDFLTMFERFVGIFAGYNADDNTTEAIGVAVSTMLDNITTSISTAADGLSVSGQTIAEAILAGMTNESTKNSYDQTGKQLASSLISGLNSMETAVKNAAQSIGMKTQVEFSAQSSKFVTTGKLFMINLVRGMKSYENAIVGAGQWAAGKAKEGTEQLNGNTADQFASSGGAAAQGFINGLTAPERLAAAFNAGVALANAALEGLNSVEGLDINSPSKKARKSGVSVGEGLVLGMQDMMAAVATTGGELGSSVLDPLNYYAESVARTLSDNIGDDLVITPILDLSQVQAGAQRLSGILAENSSIAASSIGDRFDQNRGGNARQIVFNQYNTSPKALSQIEIYRQTRNQLSFAKGIVNK